MNNLKLLYFFPVFFKNVSFVKFIQPKIKKREKMTAKKLKLKRFFRN